MFCLHVFLSVFFSPFDDKSAIEVLVFSLFCMLLLLSSALSPIIPFGSSRSLLHFLLLPFIAHSYKSQGSLSEGLATVPF